MPNETPTSGTVATPPASGTFYGGDNPSIAIPDQPSGIPDQPRQPDQPSQPNQDTSQEQTMEQALEAFNAGVAGTGIETGPLVPGSAPLETIARTVLPRKWS